MVSYEPGESTSYMFGGNSNWRGPIWFPLNFLFIEALERYYQFYGDSLRVECPTGSGQYMNLSQVAREIERRTARSLSAETRAYGHVTAKKRLLGTTLTGATCSFSTSTSTPIADAAWAPVIRRDGLHSLR